VCTVVVSLAPQDAVPLLLLGFRDELTTRPWRPPAAHWAGSPLIGGIDEQAGGTWLAIHPGIPRVACILNGRGQPAPEVTRRSRGELPLMAARDGAKTLAALAEGPAALAEAPARLADYDPFHLVHADRTSVAVLSWDGRSASERTLPPGTHLITNAGLDPADPKVRHFAHAFAARRPSGSPGMSIAEAWQPWLTLAGGDGLDPTDPRAIRVRKTLPDGRSYGTTSLSLVALGRSGLRYDFQSIPADAAPHPVELLPERNSYPSRVGRPNSGNSRPVSRKQLNRLNRSPEISCTCSAHAAWPPAGSGL